MWKLARAKSLAMKKKESHTKKKEMPNPPEWLQKMMQGHHPQEEEDIARLKLLLNISPSKRAEEDADEIYTIIFKNFRNFFEGLSKEGCQHICRQVRFEEYEEDEVVYEQNDAPRAYYYLLRGRISLHAREEVDPSDLQSLSAHSSDDEGAAAHNKELRGILDDASLGTASLEDMDGFLDHGTEPLSAEQDYKVPQLSARSNAQLLARLNRERIYGEKVHHLTPGHGFGEADFLDFDNPLGRRSRRSSPAPLDKTIGLTTLLGHVGQSGGGGGPRRAMTAISDGDPLHQGLEITLQHPLNRVLLLAVPREIFMVEQMQAMMEKSDYERKVMWLKGNPVFRALPHLTVLRLGYAMDGPLKLRQGDYAFKKGGPVDQVVLVKNGQLTLGLDIKGDPQIQDGRHVKMEVALCGAGDLCGLVDIITGAHEHRFTALCSHHAEVYLVKKRAFREHVLTCKRVRALLHKIARERLEWERLRIDFLKSHKGVHAALSRDIMAFSRFTLNGDSLLTRAQLAQRRQHMRQIGELLRTSRTLLRTAQLRHTRGDLAAALRGYEGVQKVCMQAMILSETVGPNARAFHREAVERSDRARTLRREAEQDKNISFSQTLLLTTSRFIGKIGGLKSTDTITTKSSLEEGLGKPWGEREGPGSYVSSLAAGGGSGATEQARLGGEKTAASGASRSAPVFPRLPGKKEEFPQVKSDVLKLTRVASVRLRTESDLHRFQKAFRHYPSSSVALAHKSHSRLLAQERSSQARLKKMSKTMRDRQASLAVREAALAEALSRAASPIARPPPPPPRSPSPPGRPRGGGGGGGGSPLAPSPPPPRGRGGSARASASPRKAAAVRAAAAAAAAGP